MDLTATFQALLQSVLTRRIPPREGIRGLTAFAAVDFDSNPAYVNYYKSCPATVELTPELVRATLQAFLADALTARELRDWALFIVLSAGYRAPAPPAHDEDWYDPLWDALTELACPEVHGPINAETVQQKLASLDRYLPRP